VRHPPFHRVTAFRRAPLRLAPLNYLRKKGPPLAFASRGRGSRCLVWVRMALAIGVVPPRPHAPSPTSRVLTHLLTHCYRSEYSTHRLVASNTASTAAVSALSFTSAVPVSSTVSRSNRAVIPTNTNS